MMDQDRQQLMDGKTILYTYSGGLRFEVRFAKGKASYQAIGQHCPEPRLQLARALGADVAQY